MGEQTLIDYLREAVEQKRRKREAERLMGDLTEIVAADERLQEALRGSNVSRKVRRAVLDLHLAIAAARPTGEGES